MSDSPDGYGLYTHDEYEENDLMGDNSEEEDQEAPALGDRSGTGEENPGSKDQRCVEAGTTTRSSVVQAAGEVTKLPVATLIKPPQNDQAEDLQDPGAHGDIGDQRGDHGVDSMDKNGGLEASHMVGQGVKNRNPKLVAAAAAAAKARDAALQAAQAAMIALKEAEERQQELEALSQEELSYNSIMGAPEKEQTEVNEKTALEALEAGCFEASCLLSEKKTAAMEVSKVDKLRRGVEAGKWVDPLHDSPNTAKEEGIEGVNAAAATKGVMSTVAQADGHQPGLEDEEMLGDGAGTGAMPAKKTDRHDKHDQKIVGEASAVSTAWSRIEAQRKGRRAALRPRGGTIGAACHRCGSTRPGHLRMCLRGARSKRIARQLVDEAVTPASVLACTWCLSSFKNVGYVLEAEPRVSTLPSSQSLPPPSSEGSAASTLRARKPRGSAVKKSRGSAVKGGSRPLVEVDTYRDRLGDSFQATDLPEVGSFVPAEDKMIFEQVWNPALPSGSNAAAAAEDVESLVAENRDVASSNKCLEILNRFNGYHAGARRHLSNLRAWSESSMGTAATNQTARARAIVATARARITAGHGRFVADDLGELPQKQVEGGISVASRPSGEGSADPRNGLLLDLDVSRVFSNQDVSLFENAMMEAVDDYSTPLANVFSRVQKVFHDRQVCELQDFYYLVWKNTAKYKDYKEIRRRRYQGISPEGKALEVACAVCRKESLNVTTCAAWGCKVVFHRRCGVKMAKATTAKRGRSGGSGKMFCSERCWRLENPTPPSSLSTPPSVRLPSSPCTESHSKAPANGGACAEQGLKWVELEGGVQDKQQFLVGQDKISPTKLLFASQATCAGTHKKSEDEPFRGERMSTDGPGESTVERLRSLCRTGGAKSSGSFEEQKKPENEPKDGIGMATTEPNQNQEYAKSAEDIDEDTLTDTEIDDVGRRSQEAYASEEESQENTVTDTEIEEVEDSGGEEGWFMG